MATDYWREEMPEDVARRVLGDKHFDYIVGQGAGYCAGKAHGAWMCNNMDAYGAYRTAERLAA